MHSIHYVTHDTHTFLKISSELCFSLHISCQEIEVYNFCSQSRITLFFKKLKGASFSTRLSFLGWIVFSSPPNVSYLYLLQSQCFNFGWHWFRVLMRPIFLSSLVFQNEPALIGNCHSLTGWCDRMKQLQELDIFSWRVTLDLCLLVLYVDYTG